MSEHECTGTRDCPKHPAPESADQTRADVVLSDGVVNHRSLIEVAAALCDADESWEHHDATDDHPCLRCKALAVRLVPWLAKRDADRLAAERAEHAAEVGAVRGMLDVVRDDRDRYKARAEAAEATVARVRALADAVGKRYTTASEIRGALWTASDKRPDRLGHSRGEFGTR